MHLKIAYQASWCLQWSFHSFTDFSLGWRTRYLELMLFICLQFSQVYWQPHLSWRPIGEYFQAQYACSTFHFYSRCCFPAFLDLWLSQDRFYLGLTLVLVHFIIPSNFNVLVYSEIKGGGHPYLTALSIIGGIGFFGIQGAILGEMKRWSNRFIWFNNLLGPLMLCLLVVLSTITVNSLSSSPSNV